MGGCVFIHTLILGGNPVLWGIKNSRPGFTKLSSQGQRCDSRNNSKNTSPFYQFPSLPYLSQKAGKHKTFGFKGIKVIGGGRVVECFPCAFKLSLLSVLSSVLLGFSSPSLWSANFREVFLSRKNKRGKGHLEPDLPKTTHLQCLLHKYFLKSCSHLDSSA